MRGNQKVPRNGSPPSPPRWVKLFVIGFILLILLVVAMHLMGFGFGGHSTGDMLPSDIVSYPLAIGHVGQQP